MENTRGFQGKLECNKLRKLKIWFSYYEKFPEFEIIPRLAESEVLCSHAGINTFLGQLKNLTYLLLWKSASWVCPLDVSREIYIKIMKMSKLNIPDLKWFKNGDIDFLRNIPSNENLEVLKIKCANYLEDDDWKETNRLMMQTFIPKFPGLKEISLSINFWDDFWKGEDLNLLNGLKNLEKLHGK